MEKKEIEEKIQQMQLIEQNRQSFLMQKQSFQIQLAETESAIKELENAEEAYRIIGNVMIKSKKADLEKELASKKEVLDLRIKTLEKQETKLREQAAKLQKEVLGEVKNDSKNI